MNAKIILGLILTYSLATFSQTIGTISSVSRSFSPPKKARNASSTDPQGWQECSAKIKGGDYFPWSNAKPFPWSDIHGVWTLSEGLVPYYMKAKVIRTTTNRKILNLAIVSEGNCSRPIAQGLGYIDYSEKNVVRAIMNDGVSKYQIKLASFDVKDLEMDTNSCGDNVLAASIQAIGIVHSTAKTTESGPENIMLKKVSDDVASICRKLDK